MRISDWSSDVCSSDLCPQLLDSSSYAHQIPTRRCPEIPAPDPYHAWPQRFLDAARHCRMAQNAHWLIRSEEHTSELQSLMRISYAVFCLKKKKNHSQNKLPQPHHVPLTIITKN